MANNSTYSYLEVKQGARGFRYETPIVYSEGVKTLQQRLKSIGYTIPTDGYFNTSTRDAVNSFQTECTGLTSDGIAGSMTLIQLDKVFCSPYFTVYGKPIDSSTWNRTSILNGNFPNNVDLLSRIIWGEENITLDAMPAVAQVIKNRSNNTSYMASATTYPHASKWARVIGYPSGYATATDSRCCRPVRGDKNATDGISPAWKKAVDLADALVRPSSFTVPLGYTVTLDSNGNTTLSTSKTTAVTTQLNQTGKSILSAHPASTNIVCYKKPIDSLTNFFYNMH